MIGYPIHRPIFINTYCSYKEILGFIKYNNLPEKNLKNYFQKYLFDVKIRFFVKNKEDNDFFLLDKYTITYVDRFICKEIYNNNKIPLVPIEYINKYKTYMCKIDEDYKNGLLQYKCKIAINFATLDEIIDNKNPPIDFGLDNVIISYDN